jgi:hypothetical protein
MEKQKLEADRRLIKALTDCEPLDWTRRPNGDLVYLNAQGQKFILVDAEIQKLTDAALAKRKAESAPAKKSGLRSDTPERGAEMHELKQPPAAISSGSAPEKKSADSVETKPDPKPSAADRSSLQEQGAETPEESQPQVDITKGGVDEVKGTD